MISFTCDKGYSLSGSHVLTCLANGTWDEATPTCGEIFFIKMWSSLLCFGNFNYSPFSVYTVVNDVRDQIPVKQSLKDNGHGCDKLSTAKGKEFLSSFAVWDPFLLEYTQIDWIEKKLHSPPLPIYPFPLRKKISVERIFYSSVGYYLTESKTISTIFSS